MKKIPILTLVLFFLISQLNAQADTLLPVWVSYIANTSLSCRDVHSDCAGNVIYVGGTGATAFQGTPGTLHPAYLGGNSDAFVVKVDSNGQLVWATLLGGNQYDRAYAVEVDSAGFIYVAGRAGNGFQTTECALQKSFAGDSDANPAYGVQDGFIAKITPDGKQLVWSTYVGDSGRGFIRDIDLDSKGNVWAAFSTVSPAFPYITANAVQSTATHIRNPALVKISSDGKTVLFGTFLADGTIDGGATTLRVDQQDNVYFLAQASANTIPVTPGAFQPTPGGGVDFTVSKFDSNGNLLFCSFLGGSGTEEMETHGLEVDAVGNAIVAAISTSANYPVVGSVVQTTRKGTNDGVITKIAADGSSILYSTYLGGSQVDGIEGIGIDAQDRIYVTGHTNSADFPVTPNTAYQPVHGGLGDGHLTILSPDLSVIRYATFVGGTGADQLRSCHVDQWGQVYAGGLTASANLPVFNAFQPTLTGANTAIALNLKPANAAAPGHNCLIGNSFADPCLTIATTNIVQDDLTVYPNPAMETVYLDSKYTGPFQRVELTDLNAHVLLTRTNFSAGHGIDVSTLPRGLYCLKISSEAGMIIRKILLQ